MAQNLDCEGRTAFLGIDPDTRRLLREFRDILAPHIDGILDSFYAHMTSNGQMAALFTSRESLNRARAMQRRHWLEGVFSGDLSDAYLAQVAAIGRAHEHVGLEPRWYMAGYCFVLNELVALTVSAFRKKPEKAAAMVAAVNKAVFLDMDLAISVYLDTARATAAEILNSHADRLEQEVHGAVRTVSQSAAALHATAVGMVATAENASQHSRSVADAAGEVASNVDSVAAAAEELSSSITEISRQAADSSRKSEEAVREADRTNAKVEGLATAARKIGAVVKLINDVASQTNLLALNATIEAARAGDAGKGFAVVANEVKSLAKQTAKATEEISAQIASVQAATEESVKAIKAITVSIGEISEIGGAIAAAVEEQGAATKAIANNVDQTAKGTGDVSRNIAGVNDAASETGRAAGQVLDAAHELSVQSARLREDVDRFIAHIRNG
ncbi:MAG: globin-coupled sensor protein [Alphaproteobacteria bacterium]|nr:globin-coupled sensor protein [Alphaproteobacteria bacterium]